MIKNVFFDLDGTIVNSEAGVFAGIKIALAKYGYEEPDYATLRKCIGPPFLYSFPNILHIKEEDILDCIATYRVYYDKENGMFNCEVYEGIVELLQQLMDRGYNLMICSSKPEVACKKLLEHLDIAKYFTHICGASLDGTIDTKEQVIDHCFETSPWMKKEETVLIGDTKYDAEGAITTGIDCVGITWGFGTREELFDAGAIEVFDTCDEVLEYIERNQI